MSLNLYDVGVPSAIRGLKQLDAIIDKASTTAASKNVSISTLETSKLAPDMKPFPFQVQTACNSAKFLAVRLGGVPNVEMKDEETTFPELRERIAKTIEFLEGVKREDFDGKEGKEIVVMDRFVFTGKSYVFEYFLPNFYFHVTTAYALLRNNGIDVGKQDYLGPIQMK